MTPETSTARFDTEPILPPDPDGVVVLHEREYRVRSYRLDGSRLLLRGAVRDQKPAGLYVDTDPDPLTFHHMQVELEVEFPELTITAATVLFEAHPHDMCGSIAPHYGSLVGLVDRPRLHPRGSPALRWAARLHPHDGVVAGDGTGGGPEHLVDADRRGPAGGTPVVAPTHGPLAGRAPATVGGDPQQLPRVGRDG